MGKQDRTYIMNKQVLGILATYTLRGQLTDTERKYVSDKTFVHVSLKEFNGRSIRENHGHSKGIIVYEGTVNQVLAIFIKALREARFQASFGAEHQSFTEQALESLRSFDPIPTCRKCGEPLLEGQLVTSMTTGHRHRIYHRHCYEMFH